MHWEKKVYYKGLADIILEGGKSRICRVGHQSGDPGEPSFLLCPSKVLCCRCRKNSGDVWRVTAKELHPASLGEAKLLSPQAFQGAEALARNGAICFTQSDDLNSNPPQNTLVGTPRVPANPWAPWPSQANMEEPAQEFHVIICWKALKILCVKAPNSVVFSVSPVVRWWIPKKNF
jgi:hypothetical protein